MAPDRPTMNAGTWNERALSLIRSAVLAPSSHNTQPWRFRISPSTIDLYADRSRALPVNDPQDRELTISCGCALMNLRVAAEDAGLRTQVRLLPDAAEPDWLARVSLDENSGESIAAIALSGFIERRRTYRKGFALQEVDPVACDDLIEAAKAEGAWLQPLLDQESRARAAILVAQGDGLQWADPRWRRELAAWMQPRRRGDGLTVPALARPVIRFFVRSFDMGNGVGAKDRALAESSPLLAVLGTERDEPRDWLLAGQALQRVLLTACKLGLQASYLNQPVQAASLRPELGRMTGGKIPQILLRLGYPSGDIPAAARRDVGAVIEKAA